MKFLAVAGLLSALAVSAHAQSEASPPAAARFPGVYVGAAVGADWLGSQTYRTTTLPFVDNGYASSVTSHVSTQAATSLTGRLILGRAFQNGVRVEVEVSAANDPLRFKGASESIDVTGAGAPGAIPLAVQADRTIQGRYRQYGFMLNVLYDLPTPAAWARPYVGLGAGVQVASVRDMRLIVEGVSDAYEGRTSASTWMNGTTDIEPSPALQLIVGSAFPLKAVPGLSLTADYRVLGVVSRDIPHGPTNAIGYGVGNWGGSCNTFTNYCDASSLRTGAVTGGLSQAVMVGFRYQIQ